MTTLEQALNAPGCERIKDYYAVGPVQRAAVESFAEALYEAAVQHMVNRFLGWKLPQDFAPDAGISFDKSYVDKWGMPTGTNLLHAGQAKEMFEYCLKEMK